jgi:hypothetical protein
MSKNVVETEGPQMTSPYGAYALHAGLARLRGVPEKHLNVFWVPSSHCILTHSVGQSLVLPGSDLRHSFPVVPRGCSTIQKHWNVKFAGQQVAKLLGAGYAFFHCYTTYRDERADVHRPKPRVLTCNSVNKPTKCVCQTSFRGGTPKIIKRRLLAQGVYSNISNFRTETLAIFRSMFIIFAVF